MTAPAGSMRPIADDGLVPLEARVLKKFRHFGKAFISENYRSEM